METVDMNRKLKITAALLLLGGLAAVASVLGWVASARRLRLAPMARADAGRAWITNAVNAVRPLSLSRAQVGGLTMTPTTTKLLVAMGASLVALLVFAPRSAPAFNSTATATVTSAATTVAAAPPKSGRRMHWVRSHTAALSLERRAARFGSTAVIGLESMHDLASLRQSYGFETVQAMPALRAARVHVDDAELHALLAHAPGDRRVRYVSAVGPPRRVLNLPSDPLVQNMDPKTTLPYEWQFAAANLGGALDLTAGNPRIQVGVVDTGVDFVPDLAGKIDGLYDVTGRGTQRSTSTAGNDDYGHGTAVASLIAAVDGDGFGMAGFGGDAHVIGIHAGRQGRFYDLDIAQAIAKLDALGVRIVNLSIGAPYPSSPILVDAIDKAATDGMLIVAASGNEGGPVDWPASLLQQSVGGESYGLAVGAANAEGDQASFSNDGEHLSLVAPGIFAGDCSGVLVALPRRNQLSGTCYPQWTGSGGSEYGYVAGTSFASPEVAGVAALVWATRPELRNYQVAGIIKASADRDAGAGWTPTLGCGRLDAAAAVALALSRTAAEWASGAPSGAGPCSAEGVVPPALPHTQTITFKPIPDRTTADGDFNPNAHASSGLAVTYTAYGGCTKYHGIVHVFAFGLCWITAFQNGNGDVYPAPPVLQVVAITDAVIPRALPAEGTVGELVSLHYRSTALGIVATHVVVERNGTAIARLHTNVFVVDVDRVYSVAWHAPRAAASGSLRFCIMLQNRTPGAPARSYTSCARIRLVAHPD
jgi:subtilisin family serine protease